MKNDTPTPRFCGLCGKMVTTDCDFKTCLNYPLPKPKQQ